METFGEIILDSRHNGLNKFKKYKKVHVNAKILATFGNDFDQFFHYRSMSESFYYTKNFLLYICDMSHKM